VTLKAAGSQTVGAQIFHILLDPLQSPQRAETVGRGANLVGDGLGRPRFGKTPIGAALDQAVGGVRAGLGRVGDRQLDDTIRWNHKELLLAIRQRAILDQVLHRRGDPVDRLRPAKPDVRLAVALVAPDLDGNLLVICIGQGDHRAGRVQTGLFRGHAVACGIVFDGILKRFDAIGDLGNLPIGGFLFDRGDHAPTGLRSGAGFGVALEAPFRRAGLGDGDGDRIAEVGEQILFHVLAGDPRHGLDGGLGRRRLALQIEDDTHHHDDQQKEHQGRLGIHRRITSGVRSTPGIRRWRPVRGE
jgi:hypothetical protein